MNEPKLAGDQIQGDSLAGFRKDHVALLFVRFDERQIERVRTWLAGLAPCLARLSDVAHFNASFRAMKRRAGEDPYAPVLTALWLNLGFTASGLTKLRNAEEVARFETAFQLGAAARAGGIGDPSYGPGSPDEWFVGGPRNEADAMLNVAADREEDLERERARLLRTIEATGGAVTVVHQDTGNAKLAPRTGHEHFGFKDGVSQPGVRGTIGSGNAFLTRRLIAEDDPLGPYFAAPGQPLLQPGEFVVGYDRQHPDDPASSQPDQPPLRTEPEWATNGSYLVYRRLRQDVAAFERFLEHGVRELRNAGVEVDAARFGAMCVGRWKSGTPIARAPRQDDPAIARDDYAPQSFLFWSDTKPVRWRDPAQPPDRFPAATMDGDGERCPLAAHVRKVNPRDEATDVGSLWRTLRRRILRRGVTYGPKYEPGEEPGTDRGLLFLSYQRSISEQFEFVWRVWSNKSGTPRANAGFDPIIGQNGDGDPAARQMHVALAHDRTVSVAVTERFIISTGGAYLFVPSIDAIENVLARSETAEG